MLVCGWDSKSADYGARLAEVRQESPAVQREVVNSETGLATPRGEAPESCTRGHSVMPGYWDEQAEIAEVIEPARWMDIGDLVVMDDEGCLNGVGRIKRMVTRGGENVCPQEIEEFLNTHPDVVDPHVIRVPDERCSEELVARVRVRLGTEALTTEAVREYCTGKLAHYRIPRYVRVVEDLLISVTGKVRKIATAQQSVDELGLHDAAAIRNA